MYTVVTFVARETVNNEKSYLEAHCCVANDNPHVEKHQYWLNETVKGKSKSFDKFGFWSVSFPWVLR